MTGFGTAAAATGWGRKSVEMRSLNHRFTGGRGRLPGAAPIQRLLAFPEIVRLEETREDAEGLWGDLENIVGAALDGLLRMRAEEGGRLAADAGGRIARVEALLGQVLERGVQGG